MMKKLFLAALLALSSLGAQATDVFPLWDVESSSVAAKFTLDPGVNTTITTTQAFSPTHSLVFNPGGDPPAADLGSAASNSTLYYKFRWWLSSTTTTGGSPAGHHGFRFTQRVADQFTPHHEVDTFPGDGGTWGLDILDHDGGYDSGTTYHNIFTLPLNQWFLFEALFVISSPNTANGRLAFKVNGVVVYNNTAVQYVGSAGWVGFDTFLPNSNWDSGTALWYLDDLYVSNINQFDGGGGGGTTIPKYLPVRLR